MISPRNSMNTNRAQSPQLTPSTVYRFQNPQSPAYYQQKSQLKQQNMYQPQPSDGMSGNPSISFGGGTASNMRNPNSIVKTINLENGDIYEGNFNTKGEFHGYGKYYYVGKKHEYHGEFQNGRPHGRGQLYKNIGNSSNPSQLRPGMGSNLILVYDGQWRNGMKNGEGKYIYNSDNHYYQGPWVNDQRHGNQGIYVSPIGKYVGKWKNGRMDGRGQFFAHKTGSNYLGNFENNQYLNGVITYANKDEYSGVVRNGMREDSQGRYLYNKLGEKAQQVRFVGKWSNDMKNDQSGQATLTYPNGQTLRGGYKNGQFLDEVQCTYQWTDGSIYKGWLRKVNGKYEFYKGFVKEANGKQYEV